MIKVDIKSLQLEQLEKEMVLLEEKSFRAKQIYEWIHCKLVDDFDQMTNLPKKLQAKLKEQFEFYTVHMVDKKTSSKDETSKYLFELYDGKIIESVFMKYKYGNSVCISSQVGCRMGCKFCASTIGGLERNLMASEMLSQVYKIQKLTNERISNVVVMGTGEPLDNYKELLLFIQLLTDEFGLHISQRNITVSTCGLVDKIMQLGEEQLQITLAISLHASDDETRKKLMPIAAKYHIDEIISACHSYYNKTKRRITFEYSLVQGINDSEQAARALVNWIKGLNCHVNLIPVNPIRERNFQHSDLKSIQNFKNILEKYKINVTIRRELGTDIDAACGQLRKSYMEEQR